MNDDKNLIIHFNDGTTMNVSFLMPATKAARCFQMENQLTLVLDLKVAALQPLIK